MLGMASREKCQVQELTLKTEEGSICEMLYKRQNHRERRGVAGAEDWIGAQLQTGLRIPGQEEDAVHFDWDVEYISYFAPVMREVRDASPEELPLPLQKTWWVKFRLRDKA